MTPIRIDLTRDQLVSIADKEAERYDKDKFTSDRSAVLHNLWSKVRQDAIAGDNLSPTARMALEHAIGARTTHVSVYWRDQRII